MAQRSSTRALGGIVARTNYDCSTWVFEILEVRPNDRVVEVGFWSGVVIQRLPSR
jgi:hypothetical protein